MTALNKQALRGQSVEGSYYLAECGHCGEMYPSNKLDGGEPLFSGDYGECFCHLCGADDSDIADNGAWGSEAVIAWNYQQKRIEALLDEMVAKDRLNAELIEKQRLIDICQGQGLEHRIAAEKRAEAAEKRIAELESNEIREDGNQFLVVRHPGKTPVIKHWSGDPEEFLRNLIEQDPLVTIDIITHRYYGVGGQWVQDADEYLNMMAAAGIGVKGE